MTPNIFVLPLRHCIISQCLKTCCL